MAGAVNLDITPDTEPEVVHNLDVFPWPFPDNRFTEVYARDVVEHLHDVVGVMNELYRICQPGARIHITLPHYSCSNAFTDPTHRHYFGWFSFDYFTGTHEHCYYTRARFQMVKRMMIFYPTLMNKVIHRLATRFPTQYERRWAWIFPAWFLSFELEVVKDSN